MYNLIMSAGDDTWANKTVELDLSRMFEYTEETVKKQFLSRTPASLERMTTLPTLFAYEIGGGEGRIGKVNKIVIRGNRAQIHPLFFDGYPAISTEHLCNHRFDFDFGPNEEHRTHWAIKDVDLVQALKDTGINVTHANDLDPWERDHIAADENASLGLHAPRQTVLYQIERIIVALDENIAATETRSNTPPVFDLQLGNDGELLSEVKALRGELAALRHSLSSGLALENRPGLVRDATREFALKLAGGLGSGLAGTITLTSRIAIVYFAGDLLLSLGVPEEEVLKLVERIKSKWGP